MSDTTIINSKAIQNLLAQSESQTGRAAATAGGASFHHVLEGALNDKAASLASPSVSASSVLKAAQAGATGASASFARALGGAQAGLRPANPPSTASKDPTAHAKLLAANGGDLKPAAANGQSLPSLSAAKPGAPAAKADPGAADESAEQSPNLDTTQTKVVNAPAVPEQPPSLARTPGQIAQSRGQSEGALRPSSPVAGQTPGGVGAAAQAASTGSRGFAAVLASAHTSATVPASLIDQASFDPSLQMTVTPQGAHLSLDTGATGPLTAQLQITNGVADVHLMGDAATVLARHGAELSLGLTAAGLQPGRLEISAPTSASDTQSATSEGSGSGNFGGEARARDESNPEPQQHPPRDSQLVNAPASTLSRRVTHVHVKA